MIATKLEIEEGPRYRNYDIFHDSQGFEVLYLDGAEKNTLFLTATSRKMIGIWPFENLCWNVKGFKETTDITHIEEMLQIVMVMTIPAQVRLAVHGRM